MLRMLLCCSVTLPTLLELAPGIQPGFPALVNKVRIEASSCLRPREPKLMWRGCRELNSDLIFPKPVRSLAPSSVGPHPHIGGGREISGTPGFLGRTGNGV